MNYEPVFLNTFQKRFKRLPSDIRSRVETRIQELVTSPFLGIRLRGDLEGFWKDRVGNYRIIYKVDEPQRRIVFYDIDLRKRVYD